MDTDRIDALVERAERRIEEIAKRYENSDPETAKAIKELLGFAIQFRVGECTKDQERKNHSSKIVFSRMDDMIEKGMREDVLIGYVRQITGIIVM
ncbi:MAG: hypothetical protein PHG66_02980 [Candidatus Colwellbacteria bacterium]|nr:hypothetical protein [Candidatus Colwellbacteria bacterium]